MKRIANIIILAIVFLSCMTSISVQSDDINSMVIYGKVTYDGTTVDGVTVSINVSYNDTIFDTMADTTDNGGKYQFDLANMDISWNTSMTAEITTTYSGETDTNTFTLTEARTNDRLHESNLVLTSPSTGGDDDDDESSSSSTTTGTSSGNGTTYIVSLGAILVFVLIVGLAYILFEANSKTMPPPKQHQTKKKKTTNTKKKTESKYVKSGITMEEYKPNKHKKKWL